MAQYGERDEIERPSEDRAEFTATWSYLLIAVAGLLAGMGFVVLLTAALWLGFTRLWR